MIQITQKDLPNLKLDIHAVNPLKTKLLKLDCLIDTGFDGIISIPKSLGVELDLKVFDRIKLELASGHVDYGEVAVLLLRLPQGSLEYLEVDVILDEEGEDILLGSRFLQLYCDDFGYDLNISYDKKTLNFL